MAVLLAVGAEFANRGQHQNPLWVVPFLSGAAHYEFGKGIRYDPTEVAVYKSLTLEEQDTYRFSSGSAVLSGPPPFVANVLGYTHFVIVAKWVFPWQGDARAVKSLQALVHVILTLAVVFQLQGLVKKIGFLILYGLNPVVLYYVDYIYPFFLQCVPSAILLLHLIRRRPWSPYWVYPVAALFAFVYAARPTVLFLELFFFGWFAVRGSRIHAAVAFVVFLACTSLLQVDAHRKNPWFTAYVGIGAYPNEYVKGFGDKYGRDLYEKHTGEKQDLQPGGNAYEDDVVERFHQITRAEYLEVLRRDPVLLVKNAVLNVFQSYAVGYFTELPLALSYTSAFVGVVFCALLLWRRMYAFTLGIGLNSLSFTPYYPPVQAYMLGGFVLIVAAFLLLAEDLLNSWPGRSPGDPDPVGNANGSGTTGFGQDPG